MLASPPDSIYVCKSKVKQIPTAIIKDKIREPIAAFSGSMIIFYDSFYLFQVEPELALGSLLLIDPA